MHSQSTFAIYRNERRFGMFVLKLNFVSFAEGPAYTLFLKAVRETVNELSGDKFKLVLWLRTVPSCPNFNTL